MKLKAHSIWKSIVETTEHAIAVGALLPIPTHYVFIEDSGILFFVRILSSLSLKDEARIKQQADTERGKNVNPFLPPEKDLIVADISDTHIAILNKFNVVEHHLLIVTRDYEDQNTLLTLADFEALWMCMSEYESLGFYNGGREAGASQQHKHLQVVPLPLVPEGPAIPIGPLLPQTLIHGIQTISGLPFQHAFVRLRRGLEHLPYDAARETVELYSAMLASVGMTPPSSSRPQHQSKPYCLLITPDWMLLVPRSREFFDGISLNSLAFAGSLFVRDEQQLKRLKSAGLMNVLKGVAIPRECP